MNVRHILVAVALTAFAPALAPAAITHQNVDFQTLPGGPVSLAFDSFSFAYDDITLTTGVYTLNFRAINSGMASLTDVRFLLQFMKIGALTTTFDDTTDTWFNGPHTLSWVSSGILQQGANGFLMSDTDAPLNWAPYPSTLAATDTVPQVFIGSLAASNPGNSDEVVFTMQAAVSSQFAFNFVGSFVAEVNPVPEPSTMVLGLVGALGILAFRRRGRA